jgi:soluble lytic murein transglycosylase-like protein
MAGEYAVLASGFRVYAERHELAGDVVRLHTGAGSIELPANQVTGFEPEDSSPPAAAASPSAPQPSLPSPAALIEQAADRHGLPVDFVRSVAEAESGVRQEAVSSKGAVGIMQLMPGTAEELSADPRDPAQNVAAGTRYLRDLLVKYQDDPFQVRKALAGYNAGPGSVDRYDGIPPYPETQRYVERVLRSYARRQASKRTQPAGAGAARLGAK